MSGDSIRLTPRFKPAVLWIPTVFDRKKKENMTSLHAKLVLVWCKIPYRDTTFPRSISIGLIDGNEIDTPFTLVLDPLVINMAVIQYKA